MTSTVGKVRVRLRIAERDAASATALQAAVEQRFLRGVLDALEVAVHARLGPEAIVHVRRLPLRWRLGGDELLDADVHRQLGTELAEGLLAEVSPALLPAGASPARRVAARALRPAPGTSIVTFVDDAHALAVALAERGEGAEPAFHHPARTVPDLWGLVAAGGPTLVALVSDLLRTYGATDALASAPAALAALAALAATIPSPWSPAATAVSPTTAQVSPISDVVAPIADPSRVGRVTELAPEQATERVATHLGGAFFLLARALELDLPEHLWCAGLSEADHIARAIAAIAPAAHTRDPALAIIAGDPHFSATPPARYDHAGDLAATPGPTPLDHHAGDLVATPAAATDATPAWAMNEVVTKTRHSLGVWLAKRGVALTPDALAVRLAALERELTDANQAVVDSPGWHESAAAATLCACVCVRLGVPWAVEPARALALRTGTIAVGDDEIHIELPLETIDIEVRRAGLDFDPGWIQWLAKTVRIAFV